jgi:hypothetical protein
MSHGCGFTSIVPYPKATPGYPHVECPGYASRFCAGCKFPWHADVSCRQYRAAHPEVQDAGVVALLREMAALGARRCPKCQFMTVKDGGYEHMVCERCYCDLNWFRAEEVKPPGRVAGESDSTDQQQTLALMSISMATRLATTASGFDESTTQAAKSTRSWPGTCTIRSRAISPTSVSPTTSTPRTGRITQVCIMTGTTNSLMVVLGQEEASGIEETTVTSRNSALTMEANSATTMEVHSV